MHSVELFRNCVAVFSGGALFPRQFIRDLIGCFLLWVCSRVVCTDRLFPAFT